MVEISIYQIENGKLGRFLGKYSAPVVPRVGEFIFGKNPYEVVEVRYLIDGPRQEGFNWVELLVNVRRYK